MCWSTRSSPPRREWHPERCAPLHPVGTSDRLRTSVRLLFVCVFLILASVLAGSLLFHRYEAIGNGQRRAEDLAFILGDHLARTVSAIDTTLSQLALLGGRVGGPSAADQSWRPCSRPHRSGVAGIAVARGRSTRRARSGTRPCRRLVGQSRADTYLFRRLSGEPAAGLVADTPLRGQLTGQWVIPFGRKLVGPDGRFAGIVVATLEPERLRGFYRTIDVGRDGIDLGPASGKVRRCFASPRSQDATGAAGAATIRCSRDAEGSRLRLPARAARARRPGLFQRLSAACRSAARSSRYRLPKARFSPHGGSTRRSSAAIVAGFGILLIFAWRMIMREIHARAEANRQIVDASRGARGRDGQARARPTPRCAPTRRSSSRSCITRR